MIRVLIYRIGLLVPTFFGVTLIAFGFIRMLPGDPILALAGERGLNREFYLKLLHDYGLDLPLWKQYLVYLQNLLHGDLGVSIVTQKPVLSEFFSLFPATMELSLVAMTIAVAIGVPAGVIAAVNRRRALDYMIMTISLIGYSMPIFWWGLVLIIVSSGILDLTPVAGRISMLYFFPTPTGFMLIDSLLSGEPGAFKSALSHLILPSLVLGTIPLAVIARQTRSAMLEVLSEDYVRTARAKGLPVLRVIALHALRNALIPVVTTIGLQLGYMFAGALLTETIFSWPGIGKYMVDSVFRRDYPVIQGGLLLIASIIMIVNLVVDLLYGLINPKVRHRA
ncbi:MAG: ABC transporter permease subunit [Hyphomicrobiales bacterium]